MYATAPSTTETDWLIGQMPAEHAALLRKACDLYSQRQAAGAAQTAMMRASKSEKAQERRDTLVAAINKVIAARALTLKKMNWANRTSFVVEALARNPTAYDLPADWQPTDYATRPVPSIIRAWEKTLGDTV